MRRRTADTPNPDLPRRLAGLRRRVDVRALAKASSRLGVEAWLVGGAVRDTLLGLSTTKRFSEIDAAVSGDPEAVARALESAGVGRAVFLSRDRPGPRVFRVARAGGRCLDIAELEGGTIETDLGRRDFTVNAIAVSLADGRVRDPFGGAADLARGRLRPVRADNLIDDPLRALRAARFLATHGLVPDRGTLEAARSAAPKLSRVAAERIGAELARILGSARAKDALAWAARAGILASTLGVANDRHRLVAAALRPLDDAATVRLAEPIRRRLRLAALALSLFPGDGEARKWLFGRRLPRREVEDAARLAELVRRAPARTAGGDERKAWRWIVEAGPLVREALHLLERSRRKHPRPDVGRLRRLARRPLRRVPVTGEDVMRWLGIPPGPRIGVLLTELAVAAASGEVKTRHQARIWLTGQVREPTCGAIIALH